MKRSVNTLATILFVAFFVVGFASVSWAQVNRFDDPGFNVNGVHNWDQFGQPFYTVSPGQYGYGYAAENTITTVTGEEYYGEIYQIIEGVFNVDDPVYMSGNLNSDFDAGSTAKVGIFVEYLDGGGQPIGSRLTAYIEGQND